MLFLSPSNSLANSFVVCFLTFLPPTTLPTHPKRSTGLAGTLTSPTATEPFAPTTLQASPSTPAVKSSTLATAASTTAASLAASSSFHLAKAVGPESPEPLDASEDCPKGSIVGLRASKWGTSSSSLTPSTGISPEVKPRTVLSGIGIQQGFF